MALLELGGKRFTIPVGEVTLGSDASCAIPLSGAAVLPRHALLQGQADGQVIIRKVSPAADVLINGVRLGAEPTPLLHGDKVEVGGHELTFVDERRVEGQRTLARTDVIRLGDEQFRFYADAAPATAAPPPPPGPAASPPQATPPPPAPSPGTQPVGGSGQAAPPPGAGDRLRHTVHGLEAYVPPSPRAAAGGSLASFLVRSGGLAGQRLSVKTPVVNIGRADYNDLVVPDPSVSTSHAKLQRREGVWVLVDLDSTNGTFVDGEQVKGDAPLAPGATVRLGDVQLVFEPSDDALSIVKGGGTQLLRTPHSTALNAPPRPASPPSQPPASPSRPPPSPPLRPQPPP